MVFVLAASAWMIVGLIVVETCRLWRCWWLKADIVTTIFWPLVLFLTIRNGPDQ